MSKHHPAILTYGETLQRGFPVLLFIGREPNDAAARVYGHELHDFDKPSNCGYWNTAYGLVAAATEPRVPTVQVKRICRKSNSSPIVFAEAHPITIPNAVRNKDRLRRSLSDRQIQQHIEHVISFREVMDRVSLVLLSGLEADSFDRSRALYERYFRDAGVQMRSIKFLVGTNAPAIRESLGADGLRSIREIFQRFTILTSFAGAPCGLSTAL